MGDTPTAEEKQILDLHTQFWEAFAERHLERQMAIFAENVTFLGSGPNENAANIEEYIAQRDKTKHQFPGECKIRMIWQRIHLNGDIAWVEAEANRVQEIEGGWRTDLFKSTVLFLRMERQWKIVHIHQSMPDNGANTGTQTEKPSPELEKDHSRTTRELEKALEALKESQAKLIHSEKMASLGELAAGIAHEIQNPLNFITNFSDVNKELTIELKEVIKSGNLENVEELTNDIADNSSKINYHGKRASTIIQSMLQHSRKNTGQKELINVNQLCDEYLRLSYHGLRAKDKSFNANFRTGFDENLPKVKIVSIDIGRVVLNLINNAFFAVNERRKIADESYRPEVVVQTRTFTDDRHWVEICVSDNGGGIEGGVLEKIFDPFFTTKQAGDGTGLGLSISQELAKAQGGELILNNHYPQGAEFILRLPVNIEDQA